MIKSLLIPALLSICLLSCGGGTPADPSPSYSPPVGSPSPIVRGTYDLQSSTCKTDGSPLKVIQNVTSLWVEGAFNYGQALESEGHVDSQNSAHFEIDGRGDKLTCTGTLVEPVFQGTCEDAFLGHNCDFAFRRKQEEKEASGSESPKPPGKGQFAGTYCIHAPWAECRIWNSCYDCSAHRLTQSPSHVEDCVSQTFEKKCRGEIENVPRKDPHEKNPYVFVNGCVRDTLKARCPHQESVDICSQSDPDSIDGCPVKGFSLDCVNLSVWTCDNKGLLPGEGEREPPTVPITIIGGP